MKNGETDMAWAIDLRLTGHPPNCFWGVLGLEPKPEPWRDGLHTALWSTRREARKALAHQRDIGGPWARDHYWNRARVVRVTVTIAPTRGSA